jgi:hypothetical protein
MELPQHNQAGLGNPDPADNHEAPFIPTELLGVEGPPRVLAKLETEWLPSYIYFQLL